MQVGPYRLLAQIGAARDGIAYRAEAPDGAGVEVRVLTGAQADPERWAWLTRRVRMAAMLTHPAALRLREVCLEQNPPHLALEWAEPERLRGTFVGREPVPLPGAVARVQRLADGLACAHRLGLAHGQVGPEGLFITPDGEPKLDFTGSETRTPAIAAPGQQTQEVGPVAPRPASDILAFADDVYALGALLRTLLARGPGETPPELDRLVRSMLSADPVERPSAAVVAQELAEILGTRPQPDRPEAASKSGAIPPPPDGADRERLGRARLLERLRQSDTRDAAVREFEETVAPANDGLMRGRLGRFRLVEKLGQGGMGAVYRAVDEADGSVVAVKVVRPDRVANAEALRRLHKEARLLAEVNNPHIANLLEVNEDDGIHYLVLEFVAGTPLDVWLAEHGRLDEPTALALVADVARALVEAHERGIVHRDLKPANVLLQISDLRLEIADLNLQSQISNLKSRVKVIDFGLARHVVESESLNMTRAGAVLGTPYYMAPEQCAGGQVDARSDVYSLAATLFHLLAGRPPFEGPDVLSVFAQHCHEPPPPLRQFNPAVSDATARMVERMLAKVPETRPPNAGAVVREIERLLRGEPAEIALHPRLPASDPRRLLRYEWTWDLESSPRQLWPYVSNTDRLNRAVGLPAIHFRTQSTPGGKVGRFGEVRKLGVTVAYQEHPFEWVEGRRLGVLREFSRGPFRWLVSVTELTPRRGGGTTLTHLVHVEPRGAVGRTAAAVEIGVKGRRALDRVYRRIDAAVAGRLGSAGQVDPFEGPASLSAGQQRRLDRLLDELVGRGLDPDVVERLGDFLTQAPPQEVARIRPLALARRLRLDPQQVVAACLHGASLGLLRLLWDLLCPLCRIPSEVKDTLRALREHGRCEACGIDYELDFANSVEMIFRAHPEIRKTDLGTYCVGGPAHSPHVAAQVRLAAGERMELKLALPEGGYRLRGPQLPYTLDFRVQPGGTGRSWELRLGAARPEEWPRVLRPGSQVFLLTNEGAQELLVRLERTAVREDTLTAARAASLALFRDLFPGEVLSPGQLVSVATATLLVSDLDRPGNLYEELGDVRAFALVHELFRIQEERIRRAGGALVKTVGEGILAAFAEPAAAVDAALDLQGLLSQNETTRALRLRVAVHRGPALAATFNDHLDYFGVTVRAATRMRSSAAGGEVLLSQAVAGDPRVAALLHGRGLEGQVMPAGLPDGDAGALLRVVAPGASADGPKSIA